MEYLQNLLDNSTTPYLTSVLLGLLSFLSPCPLATNITAIGFISKDIESKHRIFLGGIFYTLGRTFTYSILGFIIIPLLKAGVSTFSLQKWISDFGEIFFAPILIIIGVIMLGIIPLNFSKLNLGGNLFSQTSKKKTLLSAFLLGVLFALAFCPTVAIFYFGMLIPLTLTMGDSGYVLPILFSLATGLPVLIVAGLIAYSLSKLGKFYSNIKTFEKWFKKAIALLFIGVGIYYACIYYL